MKLAIGCPVYNRAWSLPRWFQCISNQKMAPKSIDLVFAYTEGEDNTLEVIEKYGQKFNSCTVIDCNDLPAFKERDIERFYPLAILRTRIFDKLKEIQPDYYFSYDSDILIPDETLKTLIKNKKDIIAPWVDLVPPDGIPNCVSILPNNGGFRRRKPYDYYYPKKASANTGGWERRYGY